MNWAACLIVLLSTIAVARCPNQDELRSTDSLLRMEDYWVQAITARDSAQLACLLAPDFTDSNWQGKLLTRDEWLHANASRPAFPKGAQHRFEELKARIYGNVGIVNGLTYWLFPDGSKHSLARFTDIFLYRARHWVVVAGQETGIAL